MITHVIYITTILILLALMTVCALAVRQAAIRTRDAEQARDAWENVATERTAVAHNFVNSARIIAIHRNGRVNHFTIARGDKTYIIETFGTMGDNVNEWRAFCGFPTQE